MKNLLLIPLGLAAFALAGCKTMSWHAAADDATCPDCTPCYVPCTFYSRHIDDYVTNYTAEKCATRDLHEWQKASGTKFSTHFRFGYRQAYSDLANGNQPRIPPIPPCKYWNAYYRSEAGQHLVDEWFEGYEAGLEAGLRVGVADFCQVPARIADPYQPYHPNRIPRTEEFENQANDRLQQHGPPQQYSPADLQPVSPVMVSPVMP